MTALGLALTAALLAGLAGLVAIGAPEGTELLVAAAWLMDALLDGWRCQNMLSIGCRLAVSEILPTGGA